MKSIVANGREEDVIYSLTIKEILEAQQPDPHPTTLAQHDKNTTQLIENIQVLCKSNVMVLHCSLQCIAISWYHQ
jgi:hypothetical protein